LRGSSDDSSSLASRRSSFARHAGFVHITTSLTAGTRLGPYEIVAPLGAGGMGEVYRARDPKLRRDVALKILPAAFAADPERRARFTREAQVLAALNHPHIAAIYGVEEADASTDSTGSPLAGSRQAAVTALVLELVEGEDLSTLIARRSAGSEDPASIRTTPASIRTTPASIRTTPASIRTTPASIRTTPASTELANSPTMTATASRLGMIVGTAAYMSPEQAKGKPVDKRTDIWAFGCVLYELLTGRRAFAGEDVADFIAAVLTKEPDWALLPPAMRGRRSTTPSPTRQLKGTPASLSARRAADVSRG
jgi:serine/threonine protein kinase